MKLWWNMGLGLLLAGGALVLARIAALRRVCDTLEPGAAPSAVAQADVWQIVWRAPLKRPSNRPCATPKGWVVTDETGGWQAFDGAGQPLWQAMFSNQMFGAAARVSDNPGLVAAGSAQGGVVALCEKTGQTVWQRETDGRFSHAPLTGTRLDEPVLLLVSQDDGRLFCLRARDGEPLWMSKPTNRCDGEPVAWQGRVAYGNCDGAVYIFDVQDGALAAVVPVGEEDQMAGGMLALGDGLLLTGTRQGHLALLDGTNGRLLDKVKISSGEAFLTPVAVFGDLAAMGVQEGRVSFWRVGARALEPAGEAMFDAEIHALAASATHLLVLAGGALHRMASPSGAVERLALGDHVSGLAVNAAGDAVSVADQLLIGVREAPR